MSFICKMLSGVCNVGRSSFYKPNNYVWFSLFSSRLYTALAASSSSHLLSRSQVLVSAPSTCKSEVLFNQVRTKKFRRQAWYRPNVYKRLKKHGLETRLSTRNGLTVLWRRIIKGRHNLST